MTNIIQNIGVTWAPPPDPIQVFSNWGIIILIVASVSAIVVRVYKIGFPEIEKGQTRKPQLGVIILVILAILSPEAIRVYSSPEEPIFMTAMWLRTISIVLEGYSFHPSFFFVAIPLTLLRLVFPLMMYRYYRSMTSRSYVIIAGVLVELPMLMFGFPLLIPLIVGLAILRFVPVPKRPISWPEQEESV
ncbi:MAG: hypothetical protein KGD60_13440 [Candidatus Thorarchaeota archaeon]|nr:hypothetical protein [Candidatus Thorarchaeota archaeon]